MAEKNTAVVEYQTDHGDIKLSPKIIRNYLVSGGQQAKAKVTDQEVMMFMALCRYQRLNPFLREAYLIKYGDEPATIVTGKEVFTKRAAANPQCNGWEAGIIVKGKEGIERRSGTFYDSENEALIGGYATIYRQDWAVPLDNTVSLNEYIRYNKQGNIQKNWKTMPATMIRKVALVQALREALPHEFAGLYSPEEMPVDSSMLPEEPVEVGNDSPTDKNKAPEKPQGLTKEEEAEIANAVDWDDDFPDNPDATKDQAEIDYEAGKAETGPDF